MKNQKHRNKYIRILLSILFVITSNAISGQIRTESYHLSFNKGDVLIQKEDSFHILSLKTNYYSLLEDENKPMLPYVNRFVLIPQNAELKSVSCTVNTNENIGYVKLPSNPLPILGHNIDSISTIESIYDESKIYPETTIENYFQHSVDGYKMVGIKLCPFVYNSPTHELHFVTSIDITVEYEISDSIEPCIYGRILKETVKNMVVNGDSLDILYPEISTYSKGSTVDYLIITADSLKDAFKEFVEWKIYKGIKSHIISIEDVDSLYKGRNKQEKIKKCLNEYYQRSGLKYALLAGDHDVIPTQYAYAIYDFKNGQECKWIPTDTYYSSLYGGDFYWDSNCNGIVGELDDNVSYYSSIIVSRLPLNTRSDISKYITNLIKYEQGNYNFDIYDRNLFVGSIIVPENTYNGLIDSHYWGDSIYNSCIKPYSNSEYLYFYDSGTNVFVDSSFFNIDYLKTFLQTGGNITHVDSHGDNGCWLMSNIFFNTNQVASLNNAILPYIFTTSCNTNNFTRENPCLGESFFLNKTGTIGYMGSTVEGISYGRAYLKGPSLAFNEGVLQEIYKSNNTNFGNALASTKVKLGNGNFNNSVDRDASRWLSLSLTTLGDAECSIFKEKPNVFVGVKCYRFSGKYYFDTNTSNCTCCVIKLNSNSVSLYSKRQGQIFEIPKTDNLYRYSFTKQGYKPFITGNNNLPPLFIQNEIFEDDFIVTAEQVTIGNNVTSEYSSGNVCIPDGINVSLDVNKGAIITNGFSCEKGATLEISTY